MSLIPLSTRRSVISRPIFSIWLDKITYLIKSAKIWSNCRRFNSGVLVLLESEAAIGGVLWRKVFLKMSQNSQENNGAKVSFSTKLQAEACNFIKKETLAEVLSCEFCEIFQNTFSTKYLRTTGSVEFFSCHVEHKICKAKCF